jgi:hypothetical protein
MTVHEKQSISYFKQADFVLRHWFRLFGMEEKAIKMPSIKKEEKLPVVLSQDGNANSKPINIRLEY